MLIERDADEGKIGIDDGGLERLRTAEARALDGIAHGIGMDAEFAGNRADFPVFGVKIAADLGASFVADHVAGSLSVGNAWIGIDELSEASADSATGRRWWIVFADTGSTG